MEQAWKNKWVYIGVGLGAGINSFNNTMEYKHNTDKLIGPIFPGGFLAEFTILPYISIELGAYLGLALAGGPLIPILAKAGYRFEKIEAFFDIGYTLWVGFTLGGTFGVNIGPGILFTKLMAIPVAAGSPDSKYTWNSAYMGLVGYKLGMGNKRK